MFQKYFRTKFLNCLPPLSKFKEKGNLNSKIRSGRKSILNPDSKKLILKQIKNDDTQTSKEISKILKENNYKWSPKQKENCKERRIHMKTSSRVLWLSEGQSELERNGE